MPNVIVGAALSLDGFMNDRRGSLGRLYPDLAAMRETELLQESIRRTGAVVMGRNAFDMAQGDFTAYEYQVPIFVLSHRPPPATAALTVKCGPGGNQRCNRGFASGS